MEYNGEVSLAKFSGYPTEDAERFLSNFSAYCLFNKINVQDPRTVGRVVAIFGRSRMYERACWERVWSVTAEKSNSREE